MAADTTQTIQQTQGDSGQPSSPDNSTLLTHAGEMAARIREFDWSKTPLGPRGQWPQSLKTAVQIMLDSRYPMFVWWGTELTSLYNDRHIAVHGKRHPDALGKSARNVWAKVWNILGPQIDSVLLEGNSTWNEEILLFLERNGFPEEAYFSFSYSPVRDESGAVLGLLGVCTEDTARVLGRRRLKTLRDIGERTLGEGKTVEQAVHAAAGALAAHPYDVPFALVYLTSDDGQTARLAATVPTGTPFLAAPEAVMLAGDAPWTFRRALETAKMQMIDDFPARFGQVIAGPWPEAIECAAVVPLAKGDVQDIPAGFLVAGLSPRLQFDEDYRSFLELAGGQIATAVAHARADKEERRRSEALAEIDLASRLREETGERTARALRDSEEQLRLATEYAEIGFWDVDLTNDVLTWPPRVKAMFGISPEVPVSMADFYNGLHPDDRPAITEAYAAAADPQGRALYDVEYRTIGKEDGRLRWVAAKGRGVFDASGRCVRMIGAAIDITRRKMTEAALLESETRFRQLADNISQFAWMADETGWIFWYNQRWYDYTGTTLEEMQGWGWQKVHHPDHVERVTERFRSCIERSEVWEDTFPLRSQEGEWRWFLSRAIPFRDAAGHVMRWFGTNTDITARLQTEEELRRANLDLEQFAYSASHDLQEPLRTVKLYSEMLSMRYNEKLDGKALEFLQYVRNGASRMEMLVRDLLAYTRVSELGRPPGPTDAAAALQSALSALAGAITESGATVQFDGLPAVRVHATQLEQLFQNLIGNAIKYRRKGVPPLVRVSAQPHSDRQWLFSVADNGIGIQSGYKERIFGLFKRLHTNDEYSGTGIGLALCQRIVERHHGRIWVESEPGKGSIFYFTVPV